MSPDRTSEFYLNHLTRASSSSTSDAPDNSSLSIYHPLTSSNISIQSAISKKFLSSAPIPEATEITATESQSVKSSNSAVTSLHSSLFAVCNYAPSPFPTGETTNPAPLMNAQHSAFLYSCGLCSSTSLAPQSSLHMDDDSGCAEVEHFDVAGRFRLETTKEACHPTIIKSLGSSERACLLPTRSGSSLTQPAWTGGVRFLGSDRENNLPHISQDISRYFSTTTIGPCIPAIVKLDASGVQPDPGASTVDHACELYPFFES